MLSLNYNILLWSFYTTKLMDGALITKIIIHFEFRTIIKPKAFDFCFELSLNKLKEGFDNRTSF
jgi:hypothetical protein